MNNLLGSFGNLHSLKILNLWGNKLSKLPESFKELQTLKTLILKDNKFTAIPWSILSLQNFKALDLDKNPWKGDIKKIIEGDIITILKIYRKAIS